MNEISFKKALKSDIPELQRMAGDIWNAHYPGIISQEQIDYMLQRMYNPETISNEMDEKVEWIYITLNGSGVGFISYVYDENSKTVKLSKLYVYPEFHGKSIGQQSLKYVIDVSRKIGVNKVYLTVNKQNIKAIKAYERFGFVNTESARFDIGNGYIMDDYIMTYYLF